MSRRVAMAALAAAMAAFATTPQAASPARAPFAIVGEEVSVPYGWVDFCGRQPQECAQPALPPRDINLDKSALRTLEQVNRAVNAAIEPVSNFDHWGTILDHWDYPTDGKGDCKIYALQKRKLLMKRGFPRQALLMTIVRDHEGQGHAILTARTSRGDFILDNLTDAIRPWSSTGYRFIKRQSQQDPNVWLSVEPPGAQRSAAR
jgi:predicted transglutaminase-like cysteine proteinase